MSTPAWPWPNFSLREVGCRHCQTALINIRAMDALQSLRDMMAQPLTINSAYRCPEHNEATGGSKRSYHLLGRAFDISTRDVDAEQLRAVAEKAGFTGFGIYPTFIHVDTGPEREWVGK